MIIEKLVGGLGNQLFQYATARALSIFLNTELKFDLSFYKIDKFKDTYRLDKFNIKIEPATMKQIATLKSKNKVPLFWRLFKRLGLKFPPYYKKTHLRETEIMKLYKTENNKYIKNDYYIQGWLAKEKYFKQYREQILNDLNADKYLDKEDLKLKHNIENSNSVAVHIRRGEYLVNSYFHSLSKKYYIKAINEIKNQVNNPSFYFFSDDIEWVKTNFQNVTNSFFVQKNSKKQSFYNTFKDVQDLMLMRSCKHQIIANSTFSWWGAWLNKNHNKIVIAPKIWFNNTKAQNKYNNGSLVPKSWIKI